jgi:hypothetical protein
MKLKEDESGFPYFESLEDCSPEFTPIKVVSLLQFFTLAGKKTVFSKDNLIPIPNLSYLVQSFDDVYYKRDYRGYSVDELFFYFERNGEVDEAIEALRSYVSDGRVWLLYTPEMIEEMKVTLGRAYKSYFTGEGTLQYKIFINIVEQSIKFEEFQDRMKGIIGYKTVCNQFNENINSLWEQCRK